MSPKSGTTHQVITGCGKMYCTINEEGGKPTQFLARIGRSGTCARCQVDSQVALIDLAVQHGATPEEIIAAISGHKCHQSNDISGTKSCPDAIAESFARFIAKNAETSQ